MPDEPDLTLPSGWSREELLWESLQEEAHRAWRRQDCQAAAELWAEALLLASHFPSDDLRRATSLANRGAGLRALDRNDLAAPLLAQAVMQWDAGFHWVATLPVERRARSSLFHQRLEARNPGGYDTIARQRHQALAGHGRMALLALINQRETADRLALWLASRRRGYPPVRRLHAACWLIAPAGPGPEGAGPDGAGPEDDGTRSQPRT